MKNIAVVCIISFCAPALAFADDIPTDIPVKYFQPEPIHITVDSLPKPYATESESKPPKVEFLPKDISLNVPEGFKVNVYARELTMPRWLIVSPEGDLLVCESRKNRIKRLHDKNKDGVVDEVSVFASDDNGLNQPFGMSFSKDYFFLGNTDAVIRFPYKAGQGVLSGKGEKIADLPGGGYRQHWTRNVVLSPDEQWLYVTIGSESNADEEDPPRASILRMKLDGSEKTTFANGLRNVLGAGFHPVTSKLYVTVNERDKLGDDLVPDYFTEVKEGGFYGWPYSYLSPDNIDPRHMEDGKSVNPEFVAKTITPDVLFSAHSAVMAVAFSNGKMFPQKYQNGAFVPFRGSWNRSSGTGYKIVFVPFDSQNKPTGSYEDFLTGFLYKPEIPETWGRPVGATFLPDGSLVFTEEINGRIFRVSYNGK